MPAHYLLVTTISTTKGREQRITRDWAYVVENNPYRAWQIDSTESEATYHIDAIRYRNSVAVNYYYHGKRITLPVHSIIFETFGYENEPNVGMIFNLEKGRFELHKDMDIYKAEKITERALEDICSGIRMGKEIA